MTIVSAEWAEADRELRAQAVAAVRAARARRQPSTQVSTHTKESTPMGTTLTFPAAVREKLGLTANATSDEVIAALNTALAKPKRSEISAATAVPPLSEADQAYENVWGAAAPEPVSAEDAALYRDVWGEDY